MSEEIISALGNLPDEMIAEAIESSGRRHKITWRRTVAVAAGIFLIVTGIVVALIYRNEPIISRNENTIPAERCLYVYYDGNVYAYHGYYDYAPAEGFEYAGMVNFIGKNTPKFSLDSNADGSIYVNTANPDIIYFRWKNWDEEIEGKPEPYLILTLRKTD